MDQKVIKGYITIAITLLIGMVLAILPLPGRTVWLRPYWVLLIIIFWSLTSPRWLGVGIAFLLGLVMDLLTGTILGQQAFLYTLIAFFVLKLQNWMIRMPLLQQTFTVLFLIIIYSIINMFLNVYILQVPVDKDFWLPVLTSMMIWPWLSGLLFICQRRMIARVYV